MYFEIECDKNKALKELFHRERCSLSPGSGSEKLISWYCHNQPLESCFIDEQDIVISEKNNKKEFQKLYKLLIKNKCPLKTGFILSEHMASLIAEQAALCDVIFRYFEDYAEIKEKVSIEVSDLVAENPFVFQFSIDYCILKVE